MLQASYHGVWSFCYMLVGVVFGLVSLSAVPAQLVHSYFGGVVLSSSISSSNRPPIVSDVPNASGFACLQLEDQSVTARPHSLLTWHAQLAVANEFCLVQMGRLFDNTPEQLLVLGPAVA